MRADPAPALNLPGGFTNDFAKSGSSPGDPVADKSGYCYLIENVGASPLSFGLGIGLALIAFCQIALIFGAAYLVIGRWVQGKPRAYMSAAIAAAYFFGRIQQALDEGGWDALSDPKTQVICVTYVATLLLFALRTKTAEMTARV